MKNKLIILFISILILGGITVPGVSFAAEKTLSFNEHEDVIYPCIDVVKEYLLAGADEDVNNYEFHVPLQAQPVTISWGATGLSVSGYTLEIATKSDFSDAKVINLDAEATSYSFKYLLRDTKYYLKITSTGTDVLTAQTEFSTAYGCPRFLDVGGLYNNCRDLGGYKVGDKTVLQNMVIRGSSPDNNQSATVNKLTEEGYAFLNNEVGINTQLDLRGSTENCGRTTSTFTSAENYVHVPLTAYAACYYSSQAEYYRQAFSVFADPNNYPIYFHCAGGADRTGTVAALLLAYLGVSEDEIIQDFVVTTFSPVCYSQNARSKSTIMPVINGLNAYSGETLSEKAESFLSSIGITQRELFNIKAIMFGESLDDYVQQADHSIRLDTNFYNTTSGETFEIVLNEDNPVSRILIDENSVEFSKSGCTLTLPATSLANLTEGEHKGEVVFEDGVITEFTIYINFRDITGELQVASTTYEGDYAYVNIEATSPVFEGIGWHFQTRKDTLYPDVQPNILINGTSVKELNDNTDMSGYTFNTFPGSTDARHRVPVTISADGNIMKLVCYKQWLDTYLNGKEMTVTLQTGFNYTYGGVTYKILSDIMYQYTENGWIKVMTGDVEGDTFEGEYLDLTYAGTEQDGDYTYVSFAAPTSVFTGIEWHFLTKRSTLYPDVQPNIFINGTSVADLNDTTDMSGFAFNTFPGSTDTRHRVPVTILARNNILKLVVHNGWLDSYLEGNEVEVVLSEDLTYTYNDVVYKNRKNTTQKLYAGVDSITLVTDGEGYSAQVDSTVATTGVLFVACYEDASAKKLVEIKAHTVSEGENFTGSFSKSGKLIKAFWLKGFESLSPNCSSVELNIE